MRGIAATIGGLLAVREVFRFTGGAIKDAQESNRIGRTTEQTIKATGAAAGVTARQVGDLSSALSARTAVDDELIQSGANLILTFRNIKNAGSGTDAIFDRTTAAALDLSAAGFGSVTSASVQLGKALNDPLKGISALGRSGVTFTAQQKEQIKALVKTGDLLSAQKIILGEVEAQVGGVAEATATNAERSKVAYGNVKEVIGGALIPVVERLGGIFADRIAPAIIKVVQNADAIPRVIGTVKRAIDSVFSGESAGGISQVVDTVRQFAGAVLPLLRQAFTTIVPIARDLFESLRAGLVEVLPIARETLVTKVLPAIRSLADYIAANVLPVMAQIAEVVITQVVPTLIELAKYLYGTVYPAVVEIVTVVAERLRPVFDQLIETFKNDVLPTIADLVVTIRTKLIPALQPVIEKVLTVVGTLLRFAAAVLGKVLPPLIRLAGFIIRNVVPVIADLVVIIVKVVDKILGFGGAVVGVIGDVGRFAAVLVRLAKDGIGRVLDAVLFLPRRIAALGGRMIDAGKDFIGGLFDGILEGAKGAGGLVTRIAGAIKDQITGLLDFLIDKLNDAIPNKIKLPGPAPDIDLPNNPIPHLARGTSSWRGGVTWVGEEGPELVRLPRGSEVIPARESAAMAARDDSGVVIQIGSVMPHNYSEFTRQMRERGRAAGLGGRRVIGATA